MGGTGVEVGWRVAVGLEVGVADGRLERGVCIAEGNSTGIVEGVGEARRETGELTGNMAFRNASTDLAHGPAVTAQISTNKEIPATTGTPCFTRRLTTGLRIDLESGSSEVEMFPWPKRNGPAFANRAGSSARRSLRK